MAQISEDGEDSKWMSYLKKKKTFWPACANKIFSSYAGVAAPAQQYQRQYGTLIKLNWTHLDKQVEARQVKAIEEDFRV